MFKVSVITPFYYEPFRWLEENIESVRSQKTQYKIQHIIINDNPERETEYRTFASVYADRDNLLFLSNEKNIGLGLTRNHGLRHAKGEYIMLLDTDDRFVEDKVEKQINFMKEHDLDMSYGGFRVVLKDILTNEVNIPQDHVDSRALASKNYIPCNSVCFKRYVLDTTGDFYDKFSKCYEDWDLWVRFSEAKIAIGAMKEVLYLLRWHGDNLTILYANNGLEDTRKPEWQERWKHLL